MGADRPSPLRTVSTGWRRDSRGYNHYLNHFLTLLAEPGFRKSVEKARSSLARAQAARASAAEEARGGDRFRSNTKRAGSELSDVPPKKRYRHHEETTDDDDDDQPDVEAVEEEQEEEPAPSQQIAATGDSVAPVAAGHDE